MNADARMLTEDEYLEFVRMREMFNQSTGDRLSTCEQMLLHVDSVASKSSAIKPPVAIALTAILSSHRKLAIPREVGRIMKINHKI